jgi:urease accessory protein
MRLNAVHTAVLSLTALMIAPLVQAHTGSAEVTQAAGLVDGFIHPLTGLDHLLVTIAAGYWAARSGNHGVRDVLSFMGLVLAGILVGAACVAYPGLGLESVLVLILIVAGITVAIAAPQVFGYALFGSFLFYHGIAHVLEMPAAASLASYSVGLMFATALLLALGTLLRHVMICCKPHEHSIG